MKRLVWVLVLIVVLPAAAFASLDAFLHDLNVQAQANLGDYTIKVAAQFGIPVSQVEAVLQVVAAPADAFMIFQIGHMAHKQPNVVLQTYQTQRGKGWGVIAKQLGIKPGSQEFHALKNGDLVFSGVPAAASGPPGKGKKKGKGNQ